MYTRNVVLYSCIDFNIEFEGMKCYVSNFTYAYLNYTEWFTEVYKEYFCTAKNLETEWPRDR